MKCISQILILSFLYYYLGCYSTQMINEENEIRKCLKDNVAISAFATRNSEKYKFENDTSNYTFTNDTLYGRAIKVNLNQLQKVDRFQIPLTNIYGIEKKDFNPALTAVAVIIPVALIAAIHIWGKYFMRGGLL